MQIDNLKTQCVSKARCAFTEKFDYTPWQRQEIKKSFVDINKPLKTTCINSVLRQTLSSGQIIKKNPVIIKRPQSSSSYSESPVSETFNPFPVFGKECSLLCNHGKKVPSFEVVKQKKRISKDGIITLLKFQIKETKNSLKFCKARYLKLISDNVKLKEDLTYYEMETHADDKKLLKNYNKYQNALVIITREHEKHYYNELSEYERLETQMNTVIQSKCLPDNLELNPLECFLADLQYEVNGIEKNIKKNKKSLKLLHNYKEKEYPEKLDQIKLLKEEIQNFSKEFHDKLEELDEIVVMETDEYKEKFGAESNQVKSHIASVALTSVDKHVKSMAFQNETMKKEIELHKRELSEYTKHVQALEKDVKKLQSERHDNIHRLKYPQSYMEKCSPEIEFQLDIPLQTWLPI